MPKCLGFMRACEEEVRGGTAAWGALSKLYLQWVLLPTPQPEAWFDPHLIWGAETQSGWELALQNCPVTVGALGPLGG